MLANSGSDLFSSKYVCSAHLEIRVYQQLWNCTMFSPIILIYLSDLNTSLVQTTSGPRRFELIRIYQHCNNLHWHIVTVACGYVASDSVSSIVCVFVLFYKKMYQMKKLKRCYSECTWVFWVDTVVFSLTAIGVGVTRETGQLLNTHHIAGPHLHFLQCGIAKKWHIFPAFMTLYTFSKSHFNICNSWCSVIKYVAPMYKCEKGSYQKTIKCPQLP